MSKIIISQALLKQYFDYRDDGHLYWNIRRSKVTVGKRFGSVHHGGYIVGDVQGKRYSEHRLIFLYHNGYLPKCIDHINHNSTDNHIENLRPASHSQNCQNSRKPKRNTSGFKGAYLDKRSSKYGSSIGLNYKRIHLGTYNTALEAHEAYCHKAKELYGEYACLD